jgi:hypothetical protein
VVPTVRHNYLLAEPEATTGSIILHIVVERPTATAQRPIGSAAQLAETPSPTGRPAQGTRSDARGEVFQVQVIALAAALEAAELATAAGLAVAIVVVAALAEVPTASEAAMSPVPPAATAAPLDQVPGEVTTVPPHDPPVAADPPASAEVAVAVVVAVVVAAAGGVNEKTMRSTK